MLPPDKNTRLDMAHDDRKILLWPK